VWRRLLSGEQVVTALNAKAFSSDVARALQHKAGAADVAAALAGKAEAAEVRGAMGRAAEGLEGLLTDLMAFKASVAGDLASAVAVEVAAGAADERAARARERREASTALEQSLEQQLEQRLAGLRAEAAAEAGEQARAAVALSTEAAHAAKAAAERAREAGDAAARRLTAEVAALRTEVALRPEAAAVARLEESVAAMRAAEAEGRGLAVAGAAASSFTGRWLWRSGDLATGGWIPWEAEALNEDGELFVWRAGGGGAGGVTATVAGLYHAVVGVFTHAPATLQLCVNGEPVVTRAPVGHLRGGDRALPQTPLPGGEAGYAVQRSRHSAGDVTCVALEEYLSLPAPAKVTVRLDTPGRAQGFLQLRKL